MNELMLQDLATTSVTQRTSHCIHIAFPNGYGASVINDGYGSEDGLYELAVLDSKGHVTYESPITGYVLGHLTQSALLDALKRVAELPAVPTGDA